MSTNDVDWDIVGVMGHMQVADAWVGVHAFGGSVARMVWHDHPERVGAVEDYLDWD